MKELVIKKCLKCGATIKAIKDCECDDCGIKCCGESMKEMKANSADAAVEKHKPTYTIENDKLIVTVNHVMEEDHYIEWILVDYGSRQVIEHFLPGDVPRIVVEYQDGMKAYSYCNKHSLWVSGDVF